jgi:hypothetical protein
MPQQKIPAIGEDVTDLMPVGSDVTDLMAGATTPKGEGEEPTDRSAAMRVLGGIGEELNPVAMAQGVASAVRHPLDTIAALGQAQWDQVQKGAQAGREGRYMEALGHTAAGALPVLGPMAANVGEQIAETGDVARGIGRGIGLLAPMGVAPAVRAARAVAPAAAAGALEAGAAARVADVMAPKVGPNKVRFGNMAQEIAPKVAETIAKEGAPLSREGLHARVADKLADAEAMLDEAADARLSARTFQTKPMVDALLERRKALTAQAVEADTLPPPKKPWRQTDLREMGKKPTPVGKDVVPGPNAARVAQIDAALAELRELGPVARYEAIRRIRQAYDGPAKAVYSPAVTADFLKAQGGKLGAADVTGVLRETLAQWDPQTATANAQYSLWRTANDVLEATAEIERTRPKVGRQISSRLAATVLGGEAAGGAGAAAGAVLGPTLEGLFASAGTATKLQAAKLMQQMATAIRNGDRGMVNSLSLRLKRLAPTAAVGTSRATSPSESRTPATAPAP